MDSISFIHFSDTHIGNDKSFQLYGNNTYETSLKLVDHINNMNVPVDFVIHSGDIVNSPDNGSIQLAKSLFSKLNLPAFFVNGNHDTPSITEILQTGISERIANAGASRFFMRKNFTFLILDTQGPKEIDPHGEFSKRHEEVLSDFLYQFKGRKTIIFCHFPPLPLGSPWVDRDMLILNGDRLHELLIHSGTPILGVFFGHIHNHLSQLRDGIFYSSAPSPFSRFSILPSDQQVRIDSNIAASFNYVTISEKGLVVKLIEVK